MNATPWLIYAVTMRAALLILVGCTSQGTQLAVDVIMRPTEIEWYISPGASCTCQNVETFPAGGACTHSSDTPGCTCYPGACLTRVSLVQAGGVIGGVDVTTTPVPTTFDGFAGDFTQANLALVFEGCGPDATLPLTNVFPPATTPTVSADKSQISWPAVPNDGFLVSVAGEFTGELCRTVPDATSQAIDLGYYTSTAVRTLRGPTSTSSSDFEFELWSTN